MPGMGVAHGRDMGGVSRGREPVTHGRAYRTSLDRPALVGRRLAGDEQHHPRAHRHGLFELQVEQMVSVGEVVAVQVDDDVGLDQPAAETAVPSRSEEHTSELQSLMRISYAVFCLKKKK